MECDHLPHSEHAGFVCKSHPTTPHRRNRATRALPSRSSFDCREIYTNTFVAVNENFRSYSSNSDTPQARTRIAFVRKPQSRNFQRMDRLNRIALSKAIQSRFSKLSLRRLDNRCHSWLGRNPQKTYVRLVSNNAREDHLHISTHTTGLGGLWLTAVWAN
jgi:hypothetical protein